MHRQHLGATALGLQVGQQQAQTLAVGGADGGKTGGNKKYFQTIKSAQNSNNQKHCATQGSQTTGNLHISTRFLPRIFDRDSTSGEKYSRKKSKVFSSIRRLDKSKR
jgi:hypothetical protein